MLVVETVAGSAVDLAATWGSQGVGCSVALTVEPRVVDSDGPMAVSTGSLMGPKLVGDSVTKTAVTMADTMDPMWADRSDIRSVVQMVGD
jgi:hypothetical protein